MTHISWRHFLGSHLRSRSRNLCTIMQCSKTAICWRGWKHFQPVAWSNQSCLQRIQSRTNQFSSQWIEWTILNNNFFIFKITIIWAISYGLYHIKPICCHFAWWISYWPYDMEISNYYKNKFLLVNFNAESYINFFGMLYLQNYP